MEAWVTTVVKEEDVLKVLILSRSLRRVMTTRKLIAVLSPTLSSESQRALENVFDHLSIIDTEFVKPGENLRDIAMFYCFSLTFFKKLVYVAPGTFVMKNSDEIFDLGRDELMTVSSSSIKNGKNDLDMSVFCFVPKIKTIQHFLAATKVASFMDWIRDQNNFEGLDESYNFHLTLNSFATEEFSIGNLSDELLSAKGEDLKMTGIMELATLTLWRALEKQIPTPEKLMDTACLHDSIAVVGLSCRLAGASNHFEFWDLLKAGRSGIGPVPKDRWTVENGCIAPTDMEATPGGFLSQPVDEFDGKLFGISPKELELLDPQQRLLLELSWEALENSSINPLSLRGSHTGVFLGAWMNDFKSISKENGLDEFYRNYIGNSFGAAAARLAFFFGLTGPNLFTESGCSSSLAALDLAIKCLRRRETNLALACGVNLILKPFNASTASFVFSADGKCKTFDESADGYGRAEACTVLVLKRYADAINDGDNIWALIRGSSCAQEGLSRSIGTPTKEVEALAMTLALKDAKVEADQVSYVETHGTGTQVGDPLEISAVTTVYGGCKREQPLILGSVKTNVGHTESCAGITGIIKVLLSMKNELIPKHLNLTKLNPKIDLESIPAMIPLENVDWPRIPGKMRLAGVSSFGITGTDGHLILQEAPDIGQIKGLEENLNLKERPLHMLKISAKTKKSFSEMVAKYQNYLENDNEEFLDVCYTANVGRADLPYRGVVLARNSSECIKFLQSGKYLTGGKALDSSNPGKICFLFPGQGTQHEGMAKELYESSPVFRMNFDKCDAILRSKYKLHVKEVMWGSKDNELKRTLYSQICIFCVEYAILKLWKSWGIIPDYVLGHSLGEFCAAVAAKILTLEEALVLVANRSLMVESLPRGMMVVAKAPKDKVEELLTKRGAKLEIAALNANEQTALAGEPGAIEDFVIFCAEEGIKTHILESNHAFHSRLMDPILESYEDVVLESLKGKQNHSGGQNIQYVSGVYGRVLQENEYEILRTSKYWIDHTREKVDFIGASKAILGVGCKYFLEIGPQPILSALLKSNSVDAGAMVCLPSLRRKEPNWNTLLHSLATFYVNGWNVDWRGFDKLHIRKKLNSLPTYSFQRSKYWFDPIQTTKANAPISGQPKLHPLLGSLLPSATRETIFQNWIDVRNGPSWIKDHVIGKAVIFPGAGFLEMCLSAGYCVNEGIDNHFPRPNGQLSIENMRISKPLILEDNHPCQVQVVVESLGGAPSKIKVFRQQISESETNNWIAHCESQFTPGTLDSGEVLRYAQQFNLQELKDSCQIRADKDEIYKDFSHTGLNFGTSFQSLQELWKGDNGILSKICVPEDSRDYIVHPVLLDSMLQAGILLLGKGKPPIKLTIPHEIKKFTWLGDEKTSNMEFMVYSCIINSALLVSVLFDGSVGNILAVMEGVEFATTSIDAFTSLLESQENNLPNMYHEVWQPTPINPDSFNGAPTKYYPEGKWLIFSNSEIESKQIQDNLCLYRPTVTVSKTKTFHKWNDGLSYGIDVNQKEHMTKLLDDCCLDKCHVEGIVYLWSLPVAEESDQYEISQPFLYLCQAVIESKRQINPKLFVITKRIYSIGDDVCYNPSSATVLGIAKTLSNETDIKVKMIDLCSRDNNKENLFHELWVDSNEVRVAYRQGMRYSQKLSEDKFNPSRLSLPQSDRFYLVLPYSKSISDLKFASLGSYKLDANEVEVKVKACALNFRDVFAVMKPDSQFDQINSFGVDFAGVVTKIGENVQRWKIGDAVLGYNLKEGAMRSHTKVSESAIISVPPYFTYSGAATFPIAFATVYYSLVSVTRMTGEDTVLIHTASGGVGLYAIQLCQIIGARIIATAGSARKREYLKRLGVEHVFHSRNINYEKEILEVTGGSGVDIVLNSLTGPGFKEATLKVCKKNARFVEMSKLSTWKPEEVKKLRPDVKYSVVDLQTLSKTAWSELLGELEDFIKRKAVKPVPYVRFDAVEIRDALKYMQKAKHIGKIVCTMPEMKMDGLGLISSKSEPLFNDRSTYLITGGLGGIGLKICNWMAGQGAKYIVLVNRSQPNESQLKEVKQLQARGINVMTRAVDIGDISLCTKLLQSLNSLPPLRGIMHAAGVIQDATLSNQSWEKFLITFRPKLNGAWNLHELTKQYNLEHFVLFSSVVSMIGSVGQSNYSAANAFLDALAWHRESIGLPALSINWGQWGEIGMAADTKIRGIRPFSPARGIFAMEKVMRAQKTQICIADLDLRTLIKMSPQLKAYFPDHVNSEKSMNEKTDNLPKSENFWVEIDSAMEIDKPKVIKKFVKKVLRQTLKLDEGELIDDFSNFQDLGLDSLMMIELKNDLQFLFGSRLVIGTGILVDLSNTELLTDRLIMQMREASDPNRKLDMETDIRKLVDEDSKLPRNIFPSTPPPNALSACKIFFITGLTGNLGPYILKELFLQHKHIEKIYCLMRKSRNPLQLLLKHIKETLEDTDEIDLSKLTTIVGDLSSEKFSLEETKWSELASEVDAVIHVAAQLNHVEHYGLNSMRTVNVHGTQRILEFCCHKKTKYLFHASSILAVSSTDEDNCLSQDWPKENEIEGITHFGYPISKMIADRLVHQAMGRGLPAKSFRFSALTGHSKTGRFNYHNNHIMMRLLCFLRLGVMPNNPIPTIILPLDISARAAIKIFLHEEDSTFHSDIFNLFHPSPSPEYEFPALANEFGYQVDIVEYGEFERKFIGDGKDCPLYPFREVYETEEKYLALIEHAIFKKWLKNPDKFYKVDKVTGIIPDYVEHLEESWEYIRRDFNFAMGTGLFQKLKLSK